MSASFSFLLKTSRSLAVATLLTLSAAIPRNASALEIELFDFIDTYGEQIAVLTAVDTGGGLKYAAGIYDTGASVTTVSQTDQSEMSLPVKCAGCATAEAIGGSLTGNVGSPQTFLVDGIHNMEFDFFNLFESISLYTFKTLGDATEVPNVQPFIGTFQSTALPTIAGTPTHASGKAALIDMQGSSFNLGAEIAELFAEVLFIDPSEIDLGGLVIVQPDLHFVAPNTVLPPGDGGFISDPFRIAITNFGIDNTANPGNNPSIMPNPLIAGVTLEDDAGSGSILSTPQTMLFDTGAQLSLISTELATSLGIDLNATPEFSAAVQGAAEGAITLPGYFIDVLEIPTLDAEPLRFLNVPIFVYDIGEGIDGIIGMNLFNTAQQILYDPFATAHPTLSVTFNTDPNRGLGGLEGLLAETGGDAGELFGDEGNLLLLQALLAGLNSQLPGFGANLGVTMINLPHSVDFDIELSSSSASSGAVPEPGSFGLMFFLGSTLLFATRRRRNVATR